MPLSTPYCSLVDLQRELKNEDADADELTLARHEQCINRASRAAELFCGRDWTYHNHASSALTVKQRWIILKSIYLPWPIKTLTAITIDGVTEDTDDWRFEVGGKEVERVGAWPEWPFDNQDFIQLTGTFGYTHPDLTEPPTDTAFPEAIRRAVTLIAAAWTGDYRKEVMGLEGGKESMLVTDIPKEAKRLLMGQRSRFF